MKQKYGIYVKTEKRFVHIRNHGINEYLNGSKRSKIPRIVVRGI